MGSVVVSGILLLGILVYAGVVIRKKIKDMKAGKFCSCGCDSCPSASKCKEK